MEIKYAVGYETLQAILKSSFKAEFAYNELLSKTTNNALIDCLAKKLESTSKFILEVQVLLESMRIEPVDVPKVKFKFLRWISDLKSLIAPLNDEGVIRDILEIDNEYLKALSEVKHSVVITDQLYVMYTKQIETVKQPGNQFIGQNALIE